MTPAETSLARRPHRPHLSTVVEFDLVADPAHQLPRPPARTAPVLVVVALVLGSVAATVGLGSLGGPGTTPEPSVQVVSTSRAGCTGVSAPSAEVACREQLARRADAARAAVAARCPDGAFDVACRAVIPYPDAATGQAGAARRREPARTSSVRPV